MCGCGVSDEEELVARDELARLTWSAWLVQLTTASRACFLHVTVVILGSLRVQYRPCDADRVHDDASSTSGGAGERDVATALFSSRATVKKSAPAAAAEPSTQPLRPAESDDLKLLIFDVPTSATSIERQPITSRHASSTRLGRFLTGGECPCPSPVLTPPKRRATRFRLAH